MLDAKTANGEVSGARVGSSRPKYTILQSCTSRSWGGLEMQALLECSQLRARGHNVTLLCSPKGRLESEARREGIETLPLETRASSYLMALWVLRRFLTNRGTEIVHAQISQDLAVSVAATALVSTSPPVVLTKRVGSFISKKDPFHRWLYRRVALVVTVSEVIRKNVLDTCPVEPTSVVTLFDGVDLDRFDRRRVDPMAVRRELGFEEGHFIIGMVGRFSPCKGHEEFLEAASIIHSSWPEIKFLVVGEPSFGEDEYGTRILESAKPLAAEGVIKFTGFRFDIPEVMASLDVLAFPSYAEAFGDVLIEAMAMRLPVVSTNCDGVLDIVVDGETGIQVPPRNARALADALMQLIQDQERRRLFGEAGRRRAEKAFDLKQRTEAMEGLYARVLNRRLTSAMPGESVNAKDVV